MLIFSGLTVALKWKEEINWFVLIFVVLTTVFYLSFGLWLKSRKDNKAKMKEENTTESAGNSEQPGTEHDSYLWCYDGALFLFNGIVYVA